MELDEWTAVCKDNQTIDRKPVNAGQFYWKFYNCNINIGPKIQTME